MDNDLGQMNRRFRKNKRDLVAVERKIESLHFEAAQLRLWKEKEIAELTSARVQDAETLGESEVICRQRASRSQVCPELWNRCQRRARGD